MNIELIEQTIIQAKWFSKIGKYCPDDGMLAIPNLRAWDTQMFNADIDEHEADIAANMDWLPSCITDSDPMHGSALRNYLEENQIDYRPALKEISQLCMRSLCIVADDAITSGPHNFTKPAKDAALYCTRIATMECMAQKPGRWCQLLVLYGNGYWPCGMMPDGTLVVL